MTMEYVLMLLAAAAGGFLQSSTGMGYSLICMAVYTMILPVKIALILQSLVSVFIIGYYAIKQYKYINFKLYFVPTVFSFIAVYFSLQFVYIVDDTILKKLLGLLLIGLALFSILDKGRINVSKGFWGMASAGLISGVFGGLTNISGPPLALYLIRVTKDKNEYNGTVQAIFFSMAAFKTVLNWNEGLITADIVKYTPILIVATLAGSFFGFRMFNKMKTSSVKRLVNIVIILVGLYYLIF